MSNRLRLAGPPATESSLEDARLLRISEAATILALSRSKVYGLIASGDLVSVTIGGARRVPAVALHRFVEARLADAVTPDRDTAIVSDGKAGDGH